MVIIEYDHVDNIELSEEEISLMFIYGLSVVTENIIYVNERYE